MDEVGELLFEDFGNFGFRRIGREGHCHGYGAAAEGEGSYADVSAAAHAVGHLADVVDGCGRRMQDELDTEGVATLGDAKVRVVDTIDRVRKNGSPFRNVAGVCKNGIDPSRL